MKEWQRRKTSKGRYMPKVLHIDEKEDIHFLVKEFLKDIGIKTIAVSDFDEALFLLTIDKYDAVILEPIKEGPFRHRFGNKQGIRAYREIKNKYPNLPVIIYSTNAYPFPFGLLSDADCSVIKSADNSDLLLKLAGCLKLEKEIIDKITAITDSPNKKIKIFISYSKEDLKKANALFHLLQQEKYSPWIDEECILPGQNWEIEIENAIQRCNFFIACLSNNSVSKEGYVQKELKKGMDMLDRRPEAAIYLIPVRLEECKVPKSFEKLQWCNLFDNKGAQQLLKCLEIGCIQRKLIN